MTEQNNNEAIEAEVVNAETEKTSKCANGKCNDKGPEIFSRIFFTLLFFLIGWVTIWVFGFVVLIQFGFLIITGKVNNNLKGFNKEVGLFIYDMIKYLSFQTDVKPFPFRDWPYDENQEKQNNSELNDDNTVKVNK